MHRPLSSIAALLAFVLILAAAPNPPLERREGGILRGPTAEKKIALEFTADSFANGGATVLDALAQRQIKASFFFTGNFFLKPEFKPLLERVVQEGHYLGPHSDKHLLYCPWDGPKKTLVTRAQFAADLEANLKKIEQCGVPRSQIRYWVPPFEHYNQEIADWSQTLGLTLINFTPGTRSPADYTENDAKNFVSSQTIIESILKKEASDPHGLNGFLLLMHFGVSPKRTDRLADRLGELLDTLTGKGYRFVRVDELLGAPPAAPGASPSPAVTPAGKCPPGK